MTDPIQPPPSDDPATRFRKPAPAQPQTAAPAPAAPAAPQRPQTLLRLLEETLTAPFHLGALFDRLALEPPPGYLLMTANFAIYVVLMLALNLVHVAIVSPASLQRPPELLAIVAAAALLLVVIGAFLTAAVVEAAALASGAAGDYRRSFQIVTLLSALAPFQAALNWLPSAWPVPLLLGGFACAIGLERLHRAPVMASRVVVSLLVAAGLGTVWAARRVVERALAPLAAVEQSSEQLRDMAAQIQQLQQAGAGVAAPGGSSLNMLSPGAMPGSAQQQAAQIQQNTNAMLKTLTPMLNDPNLTKNMTPDQAAMLQQASAMIGSIQNSLQSGKAPDPQEQARQLNAMLASLSKIQAPGGARSPELQQMLARIQGMAQNPNMTEQEKQRMMQQMMQSTQQAQRRLQEQTATTPPQP